MASPKIAAMPLTKPSAKPSVEMAEADIFEAFDELQELFQDALSKCHALWREMDQMALKSACFGDLSGRNCKIFRRQLSTTLPRMKL